MGLKRVRMISTVDGSLRPDVPMDASFTVRVWHDDGTVTVEAQETDADREALRRAARIATQDKVKDATLRDEDVAALAPLYDPWRPGETVSVGALRSWDGTIVECIQAHTTQSDWTPGATPNLWKVHRTATGDTPDAWVQPVGAHDAYQTGDEVTHPDRANTMGEGSTTVWLWRSKIDANTTEPGQDGTFHRWWEPVRAA